MNIKKIIPFTIALAVVMTLITVTPALAETNQRPNGQSKIVPGMMNRVRPTMPGMGIMGKVLTVNGTTFTMSGHASFGTSTPTMTTFTVNASTAKVFRNNATSTVSAIAVGDNVLVQGTITGTNIVATIIRDNKLGNMRGDDRKNASSTPSDIIGDGRPVVMGTVSAVNGNTVTITNKSNIIYSVDVSTAKINGKKISSTSDIKVGDTLVVQGTINGTTVVATNILEKAGPKNTKARGSLAVPGFFGSIGQKFMHMFGF